jgi:hypothetical protein
MIRQNNYKILLFLKYISNFPGKRTGDGSLYHLLSWWGLPRRCAPHNDILVENVLINQGISGLKLVLK